MIESKHKKMMPLWLMGVAALAVSCSTSEPDSPLGPTTSDNAIRFSASTEAATKSSDVTTENLTSFNVYAYLSGNTDSPYMSNVTVSKEGTAWVYSPLQYWPNSNLDFLAFSPASFVPASTGPTKAITYHNTSGTTDVVYAVATDQQPPTSSGTGQVMLNFRHALSKVDVMLSSGSDEFVVKVTQVMIVGVNMNGDFTFPTASTTGAATSDNVGKWSNLSYQYAYPVLWAQDTSEVLTLDTTPVNANVSGYFAQYMIPQTLTWANNGDLTDDYIQLNVSIYDAKTGEKVWPNASTPEDNLIQGSTLNDGMIKFPLSTSSFSEWEAGYHYIYNIVINSHPDIQPIEFGTPSVDGFVTVDTNYEF